MPASNPRGNADDSGLSQAEKRQRSKDRYRAVIETAEHNTSPKQPPGVKKTSLVLHVAGHGRFAPREVEQTIRAAREQHDLFAWRDDDGTLRYTPMDGESLRRLNIYVSKNDHLGEDAQARVKAAISEVLGQ